MTGAERGADSYAGEECRCWDTDNGGLDGWMGLEIVLGACMEE